MRSSHTGSVRMLVGTLGGRTCSSLGRHLSKLFVHTRGGNIFLWVWVGLLPLRTSAASALMVPLPLPEPVVFTKP